MLSYFKEDGTFFCTYINSPQNSIEFQVSTDQYSDDENEIVELKEYQKEYLELWEEVKKLVSNECSTGQTNLPFFDRNGHYDMTFKYDKQTVNISCSNIGGGMSVTFPIVKDVWLPFIDDILKCYGK
jgi:hypothetical protein